MNKATVAQLAYMRRVKGAIVEGCKEGLGQGLGLTRADLRSTAPVRTGAYRAGIAMTPVQASRGFVEGRIVFGAPHSIWVHLCRYHVGLETIMNRVPDLVAAKVSGRVGARLRALQ